MHTVYYLFAGNQEKKYCFSICYRASATDLNQLHVAAMTLSICSSLNIVVLTAAVLGVLILISFISMLHPSTCMDATHR